MKGFWKGFQSFFVAVFSQFIHKELTVYFYIVAGVIDTFWYVLCMILAGKNFSTIENSVWIDRVTRIMIGNNIKSIWFKF